MKPFEEREKMYQITAKEILNPTVVKMEILGKCKRLLQEIPF